ncbi:MAG: hypothetical protein ABIR81_09550 [Ginsengibacter sp.]
MFNKIICIMRVSKKLKCAAIGFLAILSIQSTNAQGQTKSINSLTSLLRRIKQSGYTNLDTTSGAGLFVKEKHSCTDTYKLYLQVIDLRKMHLINIYSITTNQGIAESKYYTQREFDSSPYFKRFSHQSVLDSIPANFRSRAFTILNAMFFEVYKDSTQFSFPVKDKGRVISGGSSFYGPIENAADNHYKNIALKAVLFSNAGVVIKDYNSKSGSPLNNPKYKTGFVTYNYLDHPARVLANNQSNRYHLIGSVNVAETEGDELLLILTIDRGTLDNAAKELTDLGAGNQIATIDGGSSVFIWNHRLGNVLVPESKEPTAMGYPVLIPHFIAFVKK